jgi:hypothetical protein
MRFHSDPLYDTWDDVTAVVSVGHPRAFVLRAVDDVTRRWSYQVRRLSGWVCELGIKGEDTQRLAVGRCPCHATLRKRCADKREGRW